MTRILFASNTFEFLESHRRELIWACVEKGFDVHVAAPEAGRPPQGLPGAIAVHPIQVDRFGINPFADAWSAVSLARVVNRVKPHILHNFTMKMITIGGLASVITPVPSVVNSVTGFGLASTRSRGIGFAAVRLASHGFRFWPRATYICQNEDDFRLIRERTSAEILKVLGSGVNLESFPLAPPRRRGGRRVLFASRLLGSKGLPLLVDGAKRLKRAGAPIEVTVAGRIESRHPLAVNEQQLRTWESEGLLRYVGNVTNMAELMADNDLVVLPSLGGEGVPKVLLEAIAVGRPFVTSAVSGCEELAHDSGAGIAVKVGDEEALAEQIHRLLVDDSLLSSLRACAVNFRSEVDVSRIVGEHLSLYQRKLAECSQCSR